MKFVNNRGLLGGHIGIVAICFAVFAGCHERKEPDAKYEVPDRTLADLVLDPNSPIRFNETVGEYQLVYDTYIDGERHQMTYRLKYSPFTRAPLPSHRADLFMEPSSEEVAAVRGKLAGVTTLDEVKKALGEPDEIFTGAMTFRTQYTYRRVENTLVVVVQEMRDGSILYFYHGRLKKAPGN